MKHPGADVVQPSAPTRPSRIRGSAADTKSGQTLVEYALILAIISILAIAMMIQLTGNTRQIYCNIDSQLTRANTGS